MHALFAPLFFLLSLAAPEPTPVPARPDPATASVVLKVPGMDRVRVRKNVVYEDVGGVSLAADIYLPPEGACTRETPENCVTADVRAAPWDAHLVGGQLTWELDGLARHRGLHWLEGGYLQATYNHDFQNNRFGNARIGDLSLSLAF